MTNEQLFKLLKSKSFEPFSSSVMGMLHPLCNMSTRKTISVSVVISDLNIKSMLDSRQRAELEELKKFLSSRQIWARIGLFISCLISFSANGMFEKTVKSLSPRIQLKITDLRFVNINFSLDIDQPEMHIL